MSVALLKALEDYGIYKITTLLNEVCDTDQIPPDIFKAVFITLPKKPGATECEWHRTIILTSHIIKILLRVILMRVRNKIKPEIAVWFCGWKNYNKCNLHSSNYY